MDFQKFLSQLKYHYKNNLPFVAYHKPSAKSINGLLQNSSEVQSVDYLQKGFVMAEFSGSRQTHFINLKDSQLIETKYDTNSFNFAASTESNWIESISKKEYEDKIQKTIDYILTGEAEKVVFSRKIKVESSQDIFQAFENLLFLYEDAFTYLWHHPSLGTWLGATPETLVTLQRNRLSTMALAGTKVASDNSNEDWGVKEKEEQNYVTQAIVNAIKKYSNQIDVGETSTKKAGKLLHLHTPIQAKIEKTDFQKILEDLHPTPAVAGLPKEKSIDFIVANEAYQRKYYTGFLGEVNFPQQVNQRKTRKNQEFTAVQPRIPQTDLYVNLRCMEFSGSHYNLYVGGGITRDSDPKAEWQETQNKSQTMLNVL